MTINEKGIETITSPNSNPISFSDIALIHNTLILSLPANQAKP